MFNRFFKQPIFDSPYDRPSRHWELDEDGEPIKGILDNRRPAGFITTIPKTKKRNRKARDQQTLVFDEGAGLSTAEQEAGDANYDVVIACAFNYEAHASEFNKLGRIPVLEARMNSDLHMAEDLKNTDKGNLFVIFGEPDIDILEEPDDQIRVKVNGVDVFHPNTGVVRSDGPEGIACWFIDTDYNHEARETLNSDTSRPFEKPKGGRIAVKVINNLGMK